MILLLGYGISNRSVSKYLDKKKIDYVIYTDNDKKNSINIFDDYNISLIIKSGSFLNEHYLIVEAKKRNIKIISDLELFYLESSLSNRDRKKIIAVTGTNGKTTTVNLIKAIIGNIDMCGNVGIPLFDFVESKKNIVIETSSYMNEYIDKFKADFYLITNIYPNHLDHHKTFNQYIKAKLRLLKNMSKKSYLIYNYDDIILRNIVKRYDGYKIPFSKKKISKGAYVYHNTIYFNHHKIMELNEIKLLGEHNLENILASVALAYCYDIDVNTIRTKVMNFRFVEHRLERFMVKNNIEIYNDSKSTNTLAMKKALDSFRGKKVLLICGGKTAFLNNNKDDEYSILNDSLNDLSKVIVCGENKEILKNYFTIHQKEVELYNKLSDVVDNKEKMFRENVDVILFSPGSQSFDEFKNFEERGKYFKDNMLN